MIYLRHRSFASQLAGSKYWVQGPSSSPIRDRGNLSKAFSPKQTPQMRMRDTNHAPEATSRSYYSSGRSITVCRCLLRVTTSFEGIMKQYETRCRQSRGYHFDANETPHDPILLAQSPLPNHTMNPSRVATPRSSIHNMPGNRNFDQRGKRSYINGSK